MWIIDGYRLTIFIQFSFIKINIQIIKTQCLSLKYIWDGCAINLGKQVELIQNPKG